jgi:uncharacterized protein (TIGR03437 family)
MEGYKGMARYLIYLILILTGIKAQAQTLSWTLLKTNGALQPSARNDGAVAWDPAGKQLFMFGGQDATSTRNDLWAFSFDTQSWRLLTTSGATPPTRFGHTLVYDSARRALLLFGGQSGSFFSDLWSFDIASSTWTIQAKDNTGPKSRYGHGAIYDAGRDALVITHGFTTAGRFDDTWVFDLKSHGWREISTSGGKPLKRCLFHSAYDGKGDQMFIFGGCASGFGPCPLDDLWSLDLKSNQWTQRFAAGPAPSGRQHNGLTFDATRKRLVVFGGSGNGLLNDTWEFDPNGGWQTNTSTPAPDARQRQETAWAGDYGTIVFGGSTNSGLTNELWLLGPQIAVVNAFSGVGGSVAPGEVVSVYGAGLGPTTGAAQSFDASSRLPVAPGGISILWNGIPSPVYYSSGGQLNIQVPYELSATAEATALVTFNGATTGSLKVPVAVAHPGVFPLVFNADQTVNSPANPAARGSIVFFFASGQGLTSPASVTGMAAVGAYPEPVLPVSLKLGASTAEILFKGQAPYTSGVIQINGRIAADATTGNAVPLTLTIGGIAAQSGITVAIK